MGRWDQPGILDQGWKHGHLVRQDTCRMSLLLMAPGNPEEAHKGDGVMTPSVPVRMAAAAPHPVRNAPDLAHASALRCSGARAPNPRLLVGCAHIYAGEMVIDIIKHAVLGKFNEIRWGPVGRPGGQAQGLGVA